MICSSVSSKFFIIQVFIHSTGIELFFLGASLTGRVEYVHEAKRPLFLIAKAIYFPFHFFWKSARLSWLHSVSSAKGIEENLAAVQSQEKET